QHGFLAFCSASTQHKTGCHPERSEGPMYFVCTTKYRSYLSLTVPLRTVFTPLGVRTSKKPRSSRPSVVPSNDEPFSSMRTAFPFTQEEFSAKRRKIELRASASPVNCRYSRSSDFSKAAASSTRDHSLPVASLSDVAAKSVGKLAWFTLIPIPTM